MNRATLYAAILLSFLVRSGFGQFLPENMPKRQITGKMPDVDKLEELERKAAHEKKRAAYFSEKGMPYFPSATATAIVLPSTSSLCIARLHQLNRIAGRASSGAKLLLDYEFKVLAAHARKLIRQGK